MSGNRQYVTLGNAATNPRASLFFMDYPGRRRLKLFAEIEIADRDFAVREQLVEPAAMDKVERAMIFHLRSEEHTSELQSLMRISYAVFCLKKKKLRYKHKQLDTQKKHEI